MCQQIDVASLVWDPTCTRYQQTDMSNIRQTDRLQEPDAQSAPKLTDDSLEARHTDHDLLNPASPNAPVLALADC